MEHGSKAHGIVGRSRSSVRRATVVSAVGVIAAFVGIPAAITQVTGYSIKDFLVGPPASDQTTPPIDPTSARTATPTRSPTGTPPTKGSTATVTHERTPTNTTQRTSTSSAPPPPTASIESPEDATTMGEPKVNVHIRKSSPPAGQVWYVIVASSRHTIGYYFYQVQDGQRETDVLVGIGPDGEGGVATYTISVATLRSTDADRIGAYGDSKPMPVDTQILDSVRVYRAP